MDADSYSIAKLFKVLANAIRIQIVLMLAESSMSYTSIQARLGGMTTGTLNFHLTKLQPLVEKINGLYSLTDLGQKALIFIESSSGSEVIRTPKKNNIWENFLLLNQYFIIPLAFTSYLISLLLVYFKSPVYIISFGIIVTNTFYARFAMEKLYQSSTPKRVLFTSVSSIFLGLTLYMSVITGIVSDMYLLLQDLSNSFNQDLSKSFNISGISIGQVPSIDFSGFIVASIVGLVIGVVISVNTYDELPDFIPPSYQQDMIITKVEGRSYTWILISAALLIVTVLSTGISVNVLNRIFSSHLSLGFKITYQAILILSQMLVLWILSKRLKKGSIFRFVSLFLLPSLIFEVSVGSDIDTGVFNSFGVLFSQPNNIIYNFPENVVLIFLRYLFLYTLLHSLSPSRAYYKFLDTYEIILIFSAIVLLLQVRYESLESILLLVAGYSINYVIRMIPSKILQKITLVLYFLLFLYFLVLKISGIYYYLLLISIVVNLYKK